MTCAAGCTDDFSVPFQSALVAQKVEPPHFPGAAEIQVSVVSQIPGAAC